MTTCHPSVATPLRTAPIDVEATLRQHASSLPAAGACRHWYSFQWLAAAASVTDLHTLSLAGRRR